MRSILDEFTRELNELDAFIKSIPSVNEALSSNQDQRVRQYMLVRRRFDYAACIVALYSSLEKFIEELVFAYAELQSRRFGYAQLPMKLTKKHLLKTAELLSRGHVGEGRYLGFTEVDMVRNLFECLDDRERYTLNKAAMVAHDMNLRTGEIDKLFAAVGIEQMCACARRADVLLEWYGDALSPAQNGIPDTVIEGRIKDLVDRRNQLTHGGGSSDDILAPSEMEETIKFIQAFARSVFAVTVGKYLRCHTASIQLTRCDNEQRYKGKVVIINSPAHRIFRGQPIFVLEEKKFGVRWGRIQSLKLNDCAVDSVEPNAAADSGIGVELDFKCPRNSNPIVLPNDNGDVDAIWNTPNPG